MVELFLFLFIHKCDADGDIIKHPFHCLIEIWELPEAYRVFLGGEDDFVGVIYSIDKFLDRLDIFFCECVMIGEKLGVEVVCDVLQFVDEWLW